MDKPLTRQRLWQLAKIESGLCAKCGKRPLHEKSKCHCAHCGMKARVAVRRKLGLNPGTFKIKHEVAQ